MTTRTNIIHDSIKLVELDYPEMPNPTEEDLKDPIFNAIWKVVKNWDVNVPTHYSGYCGASGSHAKMILESIEKEKTL